MPDWTARCEFCAWTYTSPRRPIAEMRLVVHSIKEHGG